MTIEITLKTDDPAIKAKERVIRYLLMDALHEFQANRGPSPEQYVEKRYPGDTVYSGENRQRKIQEVTERIRLAEKLHHAVGTTFNIEWK